MLGGSTDTSTKGRAGAVICEDSTNQNQLLKDSRPDQLHLASEPDAPAGKCPPIKFGVFTNLVSGSKFAAPSKLSAAAQQKMRSFASEEAPSVLADDISQPADQQEVGRQPGQPMGTSNGQPMGRPIDQPMGRRTEETTHDITGPAQPEGSCPQVKFGVFTNLKTGSSFAAPSKRSAKRLKEIFQDEPSDLGNLPRDTPLLQPQPQQQPRESAELVAANLVNQARQESAGACPQIEFGVFTNLKTGGNFAAPSKLSAAAQQKARDILHEDTVDILHEDTVDSQLPAQHDSPQHPQHQPTGPPEQTDADVSNPGSTVPEGSNPQVQPGVFTNLKTDGRLPPPSQLSAAAQQRFSEASPEEATVPPDPRTSNAQPQSHQPAGVAPEHTTAASSKASSTTAVDLCPQVQFGVFTNLRTGDSFAAPRTLSAAAQQKARDFHPEHATVPQKEGMESDLQLDTDATQLIEQLQPSSRQQATSPHVQPPCPEQEEVPHKGTEPQVPAAADSINQQETEAAKQAAPLPDPHGSAAADTAAAGTAGLAQAQLGAQAHGPHAASVGTLEDASSADNATPPASVTAASPAAGAAEAQARHSGSKWRRPPTALSRLSKLARNSPGVALPQRASAQQAQHSPAVPSPPAVGVQAAKGNTDASGLADSSDVAKQQSREEQCTQPQQQEACLAQQLLPEDMQHVQMRAADDVVNLQEPASGLTAAAASLAEPGRSARN